VVLHALYPGTTPGSFTAACPLQASTSFVSIEPSLPLDIPLCPYWQGCPLLRDLRKVVLDAVKAEAMTDDCARAQKLTLFFSGTTWVLESPILGGEAEVFKITGQGQGKVRNSSPWNAALTCGSSSTPPKVVLCLRSW
jgi:hypothetical protein